MMKGTRVRAIMTCVIHNCKYYINCNLILYSLLAYSVKLKEIEKLKLHYAVLQLLHS